MLHARFSNRLPFMAFVVLAAYIHWIGVLVVPTQSGMVKGTRKMEALPYAFITRFIVIYNRSTIAWVAHRNTFYTQRKAYFD